MKTHYCITMPDQSVWAIPVAVIAENRAQHYAHEYGGDLQKSLDEDTLPLFEEDEFEIEDWAKGNMDWAEVEASAIRLPADPSNPVDFEDGWANGEVSYRDLNGGSDGS